MSGKMVPFAGIKRKEDTGVTDSGEFGNLKFEVYDKWQTIHLIEKDGKKEKIFKKNCDLFEDAFDEIDFDSMSEGDTAKIEGSGDNADLIITIKDGDVSMHLENKKMPGLKKFFDLIARSKKKVLG
jgi:hypothetical protein